MKTWINSLWIISIIYFSGIATSCKHPKNDRTSVTVSQLDTLFVEMQMKNQIPTDNALSDSLLLEYINKADKFVPYPILSSDNGLYKAFQIGFYQLSKNTYGRIIHFEPERNDYSSVQFFIENDTGKLMDAIELAYSYSEEGINGLGSSYIIREDKNIKIFTKKYWIVYEYYMPDERKDTDLVLDSLMAYEIQQQLKVSVTMDSSMKVQVKELFGEW